MQWNTCKDSIQLILTKHLGQRKGCVQYVSHKSINDQKLLRIQHCKDLTNEDKKDPNYQK